MSAARSHILTAETDALRVHQCDALVAAGLGAKMLFPDDPKYMSRIKSWWSVSNRLMPWYIVQPRSAEDVSLAVKTLAEAGEGQCAVRSGGHSHWNGGSNIQSGVTIDLGYLNETTYDPVRKIASLGPAQRWKDVYSTLEKHGVMVAGGRDGNVGVGGLLTGGGNSYYTSRHGFVCDNLVNAQIVLASGEIVDANASTHEDLWRALKEGLSNFGIVTRFDLETFEAEDVWGGARFSSMDYVREASQALVNFTKANHKHPEAAYIIFFTHMPKIGAGFHIGQQLVATDGNPKSPAFDEARSFPEIFSDLKKQSMSEIAGESLPAGLRNVWFTKCFKNDVRVVTKSAELLKAFTYDMLKIVSADDLVTQSLWQPVPKLFADIGVAKGGNVLGLDRNKGDTLLWLFAGSVVSAEHEALLHRKALAMMDELWNYALSIDAISPWVYVNYADPSQDALGSYGVENVDFMRRVSERYDPRGVFQKMVPGSFRVSRTRSGQK